MNMRLLGAKTIKDVVPSMVDASNIHSHIVAVPSDRLYEQNCMHAIFTSYFVASTRLFADETMAYAQLKAKTKL